MPGPYVIVTVSDTGTGVPPEIRERVFEPFFTTKEPGKGTGMGLAMAYGILMNHNGAIQIGDREGGGAVFRVLFPAVEKLSADTGDHQPTKLIAGGAGHILFVEDEESVRRAGVLMLERLGYRVTAAASGKQAVDIYEDQWQHIDLVMLDLVMPELGGRDCFALLKGINPDIKGLLATGHGADDLSQQVREEGMLGAIQKPYRMADLSEILDRLIGSASS